MALRVEYKAAVLEGDGDNYLHTGTFEVSTE